MKLPVKPKDDRDIIDEDGYYVCFANTTEDRNHIVKAINCHEKLINFVKTLRDKTQFAQIPNYVLRRECEQALKQSEQE